MEPLHLLGILLATASSFLSTLGILIQKSSSIHEANKPLLCRWRFWVGFWVNTGSEIGLTSVALYFTPLALIAPINGLGVIFNALLTRSGCVCGIRETLSREEWLWTLAVLVGVTLVAVSGPGSVEGKELTMTVEPCLGTPAANPLLTPTQINASSYVCLPLALQKPYFVAIAALSAAFVVCWILVGHARCLSRFRPLDTSLAATICSGFSAACVGSFTVLFMKIFVSWLPDFAAVPHVPSPSVGVPTLMILVCAPLQLYLLNLSLAAGQATFSVPLYISLLACMVSLNGGALFDEYVALARPPLPLYIALYVLGCAGVFLGLFGLSFAARQRANKGKARVATSFGLSISPTEHSPTDHCHSPALPPRPGHGSRRGVMGGGRRAAAGPRSLPSCTSPPSLSPSPALCSDSSSDHPRDCDRVPRECQATCTQDAAA
jgi:hypothetical protein